MSALDDLVALKAKCSASCEEPEAEVAALDPDDRARAVVAHHVQQYGKDSLSVALSHGPMRFLDDDFISEIRRVSEAGGDPVEEAGADPAHVALLQAARDAHEAHREELAAAYAAFAAESKAEALAGR